MLSWFAMPRQIYLSLECYYNRHYVIQQAGNSGRSPGVLGLLEEILFVWREKNIDDKG